MQYINQKWTIKQFINLHDNLIYHLKETKDSLSGKACSIARSDGKAEYKVAGFRVRGKDTTGLETEKES